MDPLNPSLALVTGSAHRLGRELALGLSRMGYVLALHYHNSGNAVKETQEVIKNLGGVAYPIQADLTCEDHISNLFQEIKKINLPLKVLVNSAAQFSKGDLLQLDADRFDAVMDLNLRAPFLCARHAARIMPPGGLIVNITDIAAYKAWPGYPAYIAGKAGLEALTRALARSLAPQLRVNAIAPGLVLPDDQTSPADWQRLVERVPLRRPADPVEVFSALEFLIKNEYITGQTIVVDGGYSLL